MRTTNYSATHNSDNAICASPNQTYSMTHRPRFLWTSNVHNRVHNSPTQLQTYQSRLTPYKNGIKNNLPQRNDRIGTIEIVWVRCKNGG